MTSHMKSGNVLSGASPMTQSEFDQLATFIAVAEELSMEPFVSADNHEKLAQFKGAGGSDRVIAFFCHPAFLKSVLMTFRKLWWDSEPREFERFASSCFALTLTKSTVGDKKENRESV